VPNWSELSRQPSTHRLTRFERKRKAEGPQPALGDTHGLDSISPATLLNGPVQLDDNQLLSDATNPGLAARAFRPEQQ